MNARFLPRFASLLLAGLLSACNLPGVAPTLPPTLAPATATTPAARPSATLPIISIPPTFTPVPPTRPNLSPTPPAAKTSAPTASPGPAPFIHIAQPASGSKVISPVKVSGESNSTFEQNLVVAVYDASGKPLALKPTTIQAELGQRGAFSVELAFTTTAEQPGRIAVYDTSAAHGGILHLASVEVTLRPAGGRGELLTAKPAPEVIQIAKPTFNAQVSGGKLQVEGVGGPVFENQFSIALCGAGGSSKTADAICGTADNVLARVTATLQAPELGKPGLFTAQLAYSVKEKTPAWVVVYDHSARDGGLIFVYAQPVQLLP